jgi:DNA-binding response OmpR family regulator
MTSGTSPPMPLRAAPPARLAEGAPTRALVLDDDPAIGRLVRRIADPVGFATELATRGSEFRSYYDAAVPDVIILDLEIDGTDRV